MKDLPLFVSRLASASSFNPINLDFFVMFHYLVQEFWVGNEELVNLYEKRLGDAGYINFKLARTNNRGDGKLFNTLSSDEIDPRKDLFRFIFPFWLYSTVENFIIYIIVVDLDYNDGWGWCVPCSLRL